MMNKYNGSISLGQIRVNMNYLSLLFEGLLSIKRSSLDWLELPISIQRANLGIFELFEQHKGLHLLLLHRFKLLFQGVHFSLHFLCVLEELSILFLLLGILFHLNIGSSSLGTWFHKARGIALRSYLNYLFSNKYR